MMDFIRYEWPFVSVLIVSLIVFGLVIYWMWDAPTCECFSGYR